MLSRGWDDRLSESDNEQINAFLRQYGPAGAEMLLKASSIHLELGKHVASAELFERAMEGIVESAEKMHTPIRKEVTAGRKKIASPTRWFGWAAAALAATLLLAVGSQLFDWRARTRSCLLAPRDCFVLPGRLLVLFQFIRQLGPRAAGCKLVKTSMRIRGWS